MCNALAESIKMKKLLIITIFFAFISCNGQVEEENRTKAKNLVNEAVDCYYKSILKENKKIDSCMILIDNAIKIDSTYFKAYYDKIKFLAWKKDTKGLLKNNQKMIELRPNQPLWKIQRGLFYEIEGNKIEAEKFYSNGILEYENLLKTELNKDLNFRIEYMTSLEMKGEIDKAKLELENIDKDFPNNEIIKAYKADYKFKSKKEMIEYWKNGEIN